MNKQGSPTEQVIHAQHSFKRIPLDRHIPRVHSRDSGRRPMKASRGDLTSVQRATQVQGRPGARRTGYLNGRDAGAPLLEKSAGC